MGYHLTKSSNRPFDDTVAAVIRALGDQGFGVLTEIDVRATLKKKLDVDRPPYVILGACHPPSAHRALNAAPEIGVLLPCNVTVSEEGGRTVVRAMNPASALALIPSAVVADVAREIGPALERVVASATA